MSSWELYVPGTSWLHRADPRVKLLMVLTGTFLLFSVNNLAVMVLILLAVLGILRSARVPWGHLAAVWRLMLPVAIMIPLLWPLFYQAGPLLVGWWKLRITAWAVVQGFATAARIVALAFLSASVVMTTDARALLRAFIRLGLPFEAALAITIGLSYIPRIQHTYLQVTEAQMARGLSLTSGGFITRARARVPVLVAALVSTFRSADTLARALECRGFGHRGIARTCLYEIHWRPADSQLALLVLALTGMVLYIRFVLGIGSHPVYPW